MPEGFPLANTEKRSYQTNIAHACYGKNSLVVLPTGLGKTIVCALIAKKHLDDEERILLLAPTRPLVHQHADTLQEKLPHASLTTLTGQTSPDERGEEWATTDITIATPHTARNDLQEGRLDPQAYGLLIVDEAHHATGKHPLVPVATAFHDAHARILAATASPGDTSERIQTIIENLRIQHVEARGEWDDDVAPHLDPVHIEWIRVTLPNTLDEAANELQTIARHHVDKLRSLGLYESRFVKRGELLALRGTLDAHDKADKTAKRHIANALRCLHGVKLVQTQSTRAAREYLTQLEDAPAISQHPAFAHAKTRLEGYLGEHPKMRRLATTLRQRLANGEGQRALIFVQTRDTARVLQQALNEASPLEVGLFVGQGGDDGLSPSQQREKVAGLREGRFDALIATSVGEEGLDLPNVDLVVFYEPVSSAVRTIQRRGRTGRQGPGHVLVMITRGTSDEAAYWAASKRERRMRRIIKTLQEKGEPSKPTVRPNPSAKPANEKEGTPGCLIDHREANGSLARALRRNDVTLEPATVPLGDIVISSRAVVEHLTSQDLRDQDDHDLEERLERLNRGFPAPILVVEGPMDRSNGTCAVSRLETIGAGLGVPVLRVQDTTHAARTIARIAEREHETHGPPGKQDSTGGRSLEEKQRFLLEALPNVSKRLALRLLERFETPRKVFAASEEALGAVRGIGPTTATAIREVLDKEVEASWRNETSPCIQAPEITTPSGTGARRSASSRSPATTP